MHNILVEFARAYCNGWIFVKDVTPENKSVVLKARSVNYDGPTVEASAVWYQSQLLEEKARWAASGVDDNGDESFYSGDFEEGWSTGWECFLQCWQDGNIRDIQVSFPK